MAKSRVLGLGDLKRSLRDVPRQLQQRALANGVKQAATVIRDAARRNVPVDKGILKRSIRIYRRRAKQPGQVYYAIWAGGTVADKKKKGRYRAKTNSDRAVAYYAAFVEFGTARSRAKPFMRKALDVKGDAAVDAVAVEVKRQIEGGI